jgi:uncharacterized protein
MSDDQLVEMSVAGLVLDPSSNAPIVILKDRTGEISLPIWIGLAEATAIASAVKKLELARPMTHDLFRSAVTELGAVVKRVVVSSLQGSTFIAELELEQGGELKVLDARPSDAIALAVRFAAPILVAASVLEQAQVKVVALDGEGDISPEALQAQGEDKSFNTLDKDKWAQILGSMDPDDFKYKM